MDKYACMGVEMLLDSIKTLCQKAFVSNNNLPSLKVDALKPISSGVTSPK